MNRKKAPKPTALSMFVEDLLKQHPQKYRNRKKARDSAGPLWLKMTPEQRQPYVERANSMKDAPGSQRLTSQGVDLQTLDSETQLRNRAETTEREVIRQIMTSAIQRKSLDTETFFIIQCNIFCYYANKNRNYGAEIAVICFNLRDGVKPENIFHFMVKPGPLPKGCKFDAQQHSDNTHLIPIPKDNDKEVNTLEIYFKLKAFLEKKNPDGHSMPILYASNRNVKIVKGILDDWTACYKDGNQTFRVYELQRMFLELRNAAATKEVWTSMTFSDRELEKEVYHYMTEIACSYHANTNKPLYCSKSVVTRYAYIICDNCICDLEIEFIYGQHVPKASTAQDEAAGWSAAVSEANVSVASSRSYGDVTIVNIPQSVSRAIPLQARPTTAGRDNDSDAPSVISRIKTGHKNAPPKPKNTTNGYTIFLEAFRKQHPERYRRMANFIGTAAPLWTRMSEEHRKPYMEKAERVNLQTLDSGTQLRKVAKTSEREVIRQIMTSAFQRKSLATETFFIIQCNMFCYYPNKNSYYGAEITVICFDLKDGVKPENIFHFMVKPGHLPKGCKFDAQQHSDNTHLIPIPKDNDTEVNTREIYFKLKAFLEKKNPGHSMPILYASNRNVKIVKGILDDWTAFYEDENQTFRVYELQIMFLELRNAAAKKEVWTSMTFSDRELEKDMYDYMMGIACFYHANTNKPMYCSKSVVTRYAYIICDNCICDLEIGFIYGQHMPRASTILQDEAAGWSAGVSEASTSPRNFDTDLDTYSMFDTRQKSPVRSTSAAASQIDNDFFSLEQKDNRAGKTSEANVSDASNTSDILFNHIKILQTFLRDLSQLSFQAGPTVGRGRCFRRRANYSDASSVSSEGTSRSFVGSEPNDVDGKGQKFHGIKNT